MTLVFVAVFVFAAAAGYALLPLFTADEEQAPAITGDSSLLAHRESLIQELRELELDRELEKIDDAQFQRLQRQRRAELAEVLAKSDAAPDA